MKAMGVGLWKFNFRDVEVVRGSARRTCRQAGGQGRRPRGRAGHHRVAPVADPHRAHRAGDRDRAVAATRLRTRARRVAGDSRARRVRIGKRREGPRSRARRPAASRRRRGRAGCRSRVARSARMISAGDSSNCWTSVVESLDESRKPAASASAIERCRGRLGAVRRSTVVEVDRDLVDVVGLVDRRGRDHDEPPSPRDSARRASRQVASTLRRAGRPTPRRRSARSRRDRQRHDVGDRDRERRVARGRGPACSARGRHPTTGCPASVSGSATDAGADPDLEHGARPQMRRDRPRVRPASLRDHRGSPRRSAASRSKLIEAA